MAAERHALSGGRWHFQHGPIDLVIGADGNADAVAGAHQAAWQRFTGVLDELVRELPVLKRPVAGGVAGACPLIGPVARRMWSACEPHRAVFITPMAAVAGSVADELIGAYRRPGIERAWINNGGDIALHLTPDASLRVGLFADLARFDLRFDLRFPAAASIDASFDIHHALPVRDIATSGWRGRSFSLGIADSVTVLARTAAAADAAATVIANAVDVDDDRVERRPASALKDDSDLGMIPVTVQVPRLEVRLVHEALARGRERARGLRDAGLIWSSALVCQGWFMDLDRAEPVRCGEAHSGDLNDTAPSAVELLQSLLHESHERR